MRTKVICDFMRLTQIIIILFFKQSVDNLSISMYNVYALLKKFAIIFAVIWN